jgi:hypothetical protein
VVTFEVESEDCEEFEDDFEVESEEGDSSGYEEDVEDDDKVIIEDERKDCAARFAENR